MTSADQVALLLECCPRVEELRAPTPETARHCEGCLRCRTLTALCLDLESHASDFARGANHRRPTARKHGTFWSRRLHAFAAGAVAAATVGLLVGRGSLRTEIRRLNARVDDLNATAESQEGRFRDLLNLTSSPSQAAIPGQVFSSQRSTFSFERALSAGRGYIYAEQFEEAVPFLERAIKLRPDHDEPYKLLAVIAKMGGDHQTALGHLKTLLGRNPGDADALVFAGWSYFKLGDFENAERSYQEARRLRPKSGDPVFNLALLRFAQKGRRDEGRRLLGEARTMIETDIRENPESAQPYFHLAKVYAAERNWSAASKYLRIAVSHDPEWAFWAKHESFFRTLAAESPDDGRLLAAMSGAFAGAKAKVILSSVF